jgi:hypothetical protein
VLIDKLLPRLKAGGHKVLIFSQMIRVLDIIEDYLNYRGYTHERIDGRVRGNERQGAIDRFCKPDSDRFVFLLCTRAGGLGLNLQVADTVIIFDSDWNPQNDVQAQARCHRIGQKKDVKVYRLITRNTYERYMFDRASKKLGLDQAILSSVASASTTPALAQSPEPGRTETPFDDGFSLAQLKANRKEIDAMLKFGAYGAIDNDDEASKRFVEADIDKILESSSTVVVKDDGRAQEIAAATTFSTFSKASFCSDGARPEIDINDPDFWQKVLAELPVDTEPELRREERTRRAAQRYHPSFAKGRYDEGSTSSESGEDTAAKQPDPKRRWRRHEAKRLRKALAAIGWGRWEKIREVAKLRKSLSDVESYCQSLLAKCIANVTADEAAAAVEYFAGIDIAARGYVPGDIPPAHLFAVEGVPSKGQTVHDDDQSFQDDEFAEWIKDNSKFLLKRLATAALVKNVIDKGTSDQLEAFALPEAHVPGWTIRHDAALLVGSWKWGLSAYDQMLDDPELCFKSSFRRKSKEKVASAPTTEPGQVSEGAAAEAPAATTAPSKDADTPYWPHQKFIKKRFKRIIRFFRDGAKRRSKRTVKVSNDERREAAHTTWSKRERVDLYRALVVHGIPQDSRGELLWNVVWKTAGLTRKTKEHVKKYYHNELLPQCQRVLAKGASQKEATAKQKISEPQEVEATPEAVAEPAKEKAPTKEPQKDAPQEPVDELSITQCKKLVQRIRFFSRLRTVAF